MKPTTALILILILSQFTKAQNSIGFSDSTDFEYLINYRLPKWGYSNFFISSSGVNISGIRESSDFQNYTLNSNGQSIFNRDNITLNIRPRFELYKESENRVIDLNTALSFYTLINRHRTEMNGEQNNILEFADRKSVTTNYGNNLNLQISLSEYIIDDFYLIGDIRSDLQYTKQNENSRFRDFPNTSLSQLTRRIKFEPSFGLGFGRIRNVTPILRSLRLNERFEVLNYPSFSQDQIAIVGEQFTKVEGYERTYDRFPKYFWGDMNSLLENKLDQVSAFDLFYLNDVFNENLGSRFEGYQIYTLITYDYYNYLYRDSQQGWDSEIDSRRLSINRSTSISVNGKWFKNINLENQFSLELNSNFGFPLEREDNIKWDNWSRVQISWLRVISDRLVTTSYLRSDYSYAKSKVAQDAINKTSQNRLNSSLTYFIENKLAISTGLGIRYEYQENNSETLHQVRDKYSWTLNAGIKYFFNRNLY